MYLYSFVQLPDVLNRQSCIIDLQSPWQVGLAEIPHGPVLEVEVLERTLQGCQIGGSGGDGQGSQIVDLVLDEVLLQGDVAADAGGIIVGGGVPRRD